MRLSPTLAAGAALAAAALVIALGLLLFDSANRPLLADAGFSLDVLTPNADGDADVIVFRFSLGRDARTRISLRDESDRTYVFRPEQVNPAGDYEVLFSGVVDGFTQADDPDSPDNVIERRLLPDGLYTWTLHAEDIARDDSAALSGTLTLRDGDTALPLLTQFSLAPDSFTPNQDGVRDVVAISVYVQKAARLTATLVSDAGDVYSIAPRQDIRQDDEAGWQEFSYAGGVDLGDDPPPDGTYSVRVEAQDAVGQRVSVTAPLTLRDGGKPRGGVVIQPSGADVIFVTAPHESAYESVMAVPGEPVPVPDDPDDLRAALVTVPIGELLVFRLTVENYGQSPMRTTGPPPGTVYAQRQIAASLGALQQDGAWRVGIQCETSEESYPWRWAIGTPDQLVREEDPTNDNVYYYLPPGERSVVWGAVRLDQVVQTANPQLCWAGLIHEGVAVYNNRIGARDVFIADTRSAENSGN